MRSAAQEAAMRRAGAVFVQRGGTLVAAHFGSAVAELAVCRQGVGVTDRCDLAVLELRGGETALAHAIERVTGGRVEPGRAVRSGGAWWCPVTPHRVLVLAPHPVAADLAVLLETAMRARPGASLIDLSDDYAAIGLVGPQTSRLVRAAGLLHGPRAPAAGYFAPRTAAVRPGLLLCEAADQAVLLVPTGRAAMAWAHVLAAGRAHGATCVGRDAVDRLRVITRTVAAR